MGFCCRCGLFMVVELGSLLGQNRNRGKPVSGNGVYHFNCTECQKFRFSVRALAL